MTYSQHRVYTQLPSQLSIPSNASVSGVGSCGVGPIRRLRLDITSPRKQITVATLSKRATLYELPRCRCWNVSDTTQSPSASSLTIITRSSFVGPTAQNVASPSWNIADILRKFHEPRRGEIQCWCAPNSTTYVIIRVTKAVVSDTVTRSIAQVYQAMTRHIALEGDGLIGGSGYWAKTVAGLTIRVSNANNHRITWGVFAAALLALADYMRQLGSAEVAFWVYDGPHEVGGGDID